MKKIQILTMLLFSATLFTACRKDAVYPIQNDMVSSKQANYPLTITYQLTTLASSQTSLIQWNSGYGHSYGLFFDAGEIKGSAYARTKYSAGVDETITLFGNTAMLGTLRMPVLKCPYGSFEIGLNPSGEDHALYLTGTYYYFGPSYPYLSVPVMVIIDETLNMNSVWINDMNINKIKNHAVISFNPDLLNTGISNQMMNRAKKSHGTIVISSTVNRNLYDIIFNNLQSHAMGAQFSSESMTPYDGEIQ